MKSRKKFLQIYEHIKNNIYYCNNDLIVGNNEYNSALILGMLSGVINKEIIYVGEYGLGKTLLAETISSLIFSLPKEVIESSSIKGNPELSYEQLIGRPDLGELNKGNEKVIWSNFVLSQPKVIDEINRIPEHKQNILLTGMETNSWKYLNEFIITDKGPWFATKNYKDSGNNGIIPPILDRFSLCVESKNPGVNNSRLIRINNSSSLNNKDILIAYETLLQTKNLTYDEFKQGIIVIKDAFRQRIKDKINIELLEDNELNKIKREINQIKFDDESNYLVDVINAELGSCQLFGQKRTIDTCPEDCHYTNYACYDTSSTISVRTIQAISNYSKALAWLEQKNEVNKGFVMNILPYALWHKTTIKKENLEKNKFKSRNEPLELETIINIVEEISKRANKIKKVQVSFTKHILNDKYKQAESLAKSQDHPVFAEYLK